MSLTTRRTPKTSITVKATGANSRIDFDLRPSAEKREAYQAIGTKPESEQLHHLVLAKPLQFFSSVPAPALWRIIPALIRAKAQQS